MCGHFALNYLNLIDIIERFSLTGPIDAIPGFEEGAANNYYPSHGNRHVYVPAIVAENGSRVLSVFRWDLVPHWWSKPLNEKKFASFNARRESLDAKPAYKQAWQRRQRCIIPATAFFERPDKSKTDPDVKRSEHQISIRDANVFSLAGIWDQASPPETETPVRSCTIITTEANAAIARIPHNRMPVILKEADESGWLDPCVPPATAYGMLWQYPEEACIIDVQTRRE